LILQFYSIKIGVDNLVESKVDIFFSTYYGIVFEKRGERKNFGINIIAVKKGEALYPAPGGGYVFEKDDHISVIGKSGDVFKIAKK